MRDSIELCEGPVLLVVAGVFIDYMYYIPK